uniref:cadherin repeat domain-containing protein n=1 Tax=Roseibium sp. TaxID=1936156 RepID=UPI003D0A66A4
MASNTENRDQQNNDRHDGAASGGGTTLSSDSALHSGVLDKRDQHLDKAHDYHLDQDLGESMERVTSNLHLGSTQETPLHGLEEMESRGASEQLAIHPLNSSTEHVFAPLPDFDADGPASRQGRPEAETVEHIRTEVRYEDGDQPAAAKEPAVIHAKQADDIASQPAAGAELAQNSSVPQTSAAAASDDLPAEGAIDSDLSAVTDVDSAENAVDENAALGSSTGIQASSRVAEGASVTYSLIEDAGGLFSIDPTTGIVSVAGDLDAETAGQHEIVVLATASDGATQSESFTISIRDVDEYDVTPVTHVGGDIGPISEHASGGEATGIVVTADDKDVTDTVAYTVDDPRFVIDEQGIVTVAEGAQFDAETEGTVSITITATSTDGSQSSQTFDLTISDVDEYDVSAVTDTDASDNAIAEDAAAGTQVGITALATDGDVTDTVTYTVSDSRFTVDANGVVTVAAGASFDAETEGSIAVTVTATSTDGSTSSETFTVAVSD